MNQWPTAIRCSAAARLTRFELVEQSGLATPAIDRIALALGLSRLADERPAAHDDDESGDSHELSALKTMDPEVIAAACRALGLSDDPVVALRRALNRGYAELQSRLERHRNRWSPVLSELLRDVGGAPTRSTGSARIVRVEVGVTLEDGSPVAWRVNDESGQANNANTRIAGASGKGKTQLLLHLLSEIGRQSPDTGLMLLDYKGDISDDAAFVQAIGATVVDLPRDRLPINPFELPETTAPRLAARSFAELFALLSPQIGQVQRLLLTRAMQACFERAAGRGEAPRLAEIQQSVLELYRQEGRADDSVISTLADVAELGLFAQRSDPEARLLGGRWIIRLDRLRGLRQLVAFVLVEYLHNLIGALPDADFDAERTARQLRTIVAIDEAHYYLKGRSDGLMGLIRIGRSKGTPVFLSSQSLDDYRAETELEELLANTFAFGHGQAPGKRMMAGALGLPGRAASRAAEQLTGLPQFELLTQLASDPATGAQVVRCHPFFERRGSRTAPHR